jgi:polysaccharide biosynthesis protein PelA
MRVLIVFMVLICSGVAAYAQAKPLPRTVYTFYDRELEDLPRLSLVHRVLEMPLNWLGLHLEYIDRQDALPPWRDDVAGVVLWLPAGSIIPNQSAFTDWLQAGLDADKKLVIMGNAGFDPKWRDTPEGAERISAVLRRIGLRDTGRWVDLTYSSEITKKDPLMVGFEREYTGILPSYYALQAIEGSDANVHLQAMDKEDPKQPVLADLMVTHPHGGYIAEGYGFYYELDAQGEEVLAQRWFINPFRFLGTIFQTDALPKPDVTTLGGRRIFYSHMDGDGWNSVSQVEKYAAKRTLTAEVLLEEVYKKYKQLPFTVAPIVSELRPDCYGLKQSAEVARQIFALPNTEAGSHTYSHPLMWRYFEDGNAAKEERYLDKYPSQRNKTTSVYDAIAKLTETTRSSEAWQAVLEHHDHKHYSKALNTQKVKGKTVEERLDKIVEDNFGTPRSYACEPYDITLETKGSVDFLSTLLPPDKSISLYQWSGDTTPPENAIAATRAHGLFNINGGDSRFDPEYPSYSYVSPIGLKVGQERQIYSSNSNENTYTHLWSDRFFGFRHLVNTVKNTESPYRVSPFNIYYHAYSGEKQASLEALKQNIGFALSQDVAPIFASDYARIAAGYYTAQIIPQGLDVWKIANRGALQTMRFDYATLKTVDFTRSHGVIGMRHFQGSLYVALDPKVEAPIIALQALSDLTYPVKTERPYLIQSRWIIRAMDVRAGKMRVEAQGFGRGFMQFYWPYGAKAKIRVERDGKLLLNQSVNAKSDGTLMLILHENGEKSLIIEVVDEPEA